ncbi:hypothetical protein [Streptomyces sp. NPDC088725]|uniref:hypothetical protein n=1 Tax=Streptomyces sp. NPDC088725 TaxID=3365873 RepID=UPI0038138CD6
MKPLKIAAVVAGSMMALGAAAATPAFAAEPVLSPMSLNGALDTVASQGLRDGKPVDTNLLDGKNKGSLTNALKDVTGGLSKSQNGKSSNAPLLGGLGLGK